ncbi:MAG: DUF3795 domain-containing protein [Candidatus Methanofastidiosa archaeon]|jgi:hypothetical protein|nr:DUF3795 domain-containing protein [Candidatus Methanofastidiosa archaeon]
MEKEKLIAYCGLYCGDCHGYKGKVADLARDLRKELRESKYKNFADYVGQTSFGKSFQDYDRCYEVLGAMVKFRCKKGCKDGGGNPFCKIRKCCEKKSFSGCWECGEFENCEKLKFLEGVHGNAHLKNIRIIKKKGTKEFIKGKRYW